MINTINNTTQMPSTNFCNGWGGASSDLCPPLHKFLNTGSGTTVLESLRTGVSQK